MHALIGLGGPMMRAKAKRAKETLKREVAKSFNLKQNREEETNQ